MGPLLFKECTRASQTPCGVRGHSRGLLTVLTAPASAAPSGLKGDFNGDGCLDLADGDEGATVAGHEWAGQVVVVYGTSGGLDPGSRTVVNQNSAGAPGSAEPDDRFGNTVAAAGLSGGTTVAYPDSGRHSYHGIALAAGDFTGDGRADLAVGGRTDAHPRYRIRLIRGPFGTSGSTGARTSVDWPTFVAGNVNGNGGRRISWSWVRGSMGPACSPRPSATGVRAPAW